MTAGYAEVARQVGAEIGGDLVVVDLWSVIMAEAIRATPNHDPNGPILGTKQPGSNCILVVLDTPYFTMCCYPHLRANGQFLPSTFSRSGNWHPK